MVKYTDRNRLTNFPDSQQNRPTSTTPLASALLYLHCNKLHTGLFLSPGMGGAASTSASSTVLPQNLPDEIFVEGAGSIEANGRYTLRTDKKSFPIGEKLLKKLLSMSHSIAGHWQRSFCFAKDDGEGCWMALVDENQDQKKWILFTTKKILYISPIAGEKVRQGRWELSAGSAPAPTVNLQPLPKAFRLSGCKGSYDCLNGEYLPLDDGSKLMNGRPIFKHTPVVGAWAGQFKYRMHWSQGAWRICDKEHLESIQNQCIAFASDEAIHPTDMRADTVWKASAIGDHFGSNLEFLEGVNIATGTVRALGLKFCLGNLASVCARARVRLWGGVCVCVCVCVKGGGEGLRALGRFCRT